MWVLYALLSSVFAAGVAIVGKIGLKDIDSTLATTIRSIVMAVFLIIVSFSLGKFREFHLDNLAGSQWLLIIATGIFGALSWLFYFFALKNGSTVPVVAIDRLSIVFVLVFSLMFLGDKFSIQAVIGALLMVGGALLISFK